MQCAIHNAQLLHAYAFASGHQAQQRDRVLRIDFSSASRDEAVTMLIAITRGTHTATSTASLLMMRH